MPVDLTTQFGGLTLCSPIVIGTCPMTDQELTRIALISGGAGAIVLLSLFEEQVSNYLNLLLRCLGSTISLDLFCKYNSFDSSTLKG